MKDYKEMSENVFRRIGEYEAEKKKKTRTVTGIAVTCALCLVIGGSAAGLFFGNKAPVQTTEDLAVMDPSGRTDTVDSVGKKQEMRADTAEKSPATDRVIADTPVTEAPEVVTEAPSVPDVTSAPDENASRVDPDDKTADYILADPAPAEPIGDPGVSGMMFCLGLDNFVRMTDAQLVEYYGADFFPEVPEGFVRKDDALGIYRRENGTGDVYFDLNHVNYWAADGKTLVSVGVAKVCTFEAPTEGTGREVKNIGGVDVSFEYYQKFEEYSSIIASFDLNGTHLWVTFQFVTPKTAEAVVASIIG